MPNVNEQFDFLPSYGRRRGRKLTPYQQELFNTLYTKICIKPEDGLDDKNLFSDLKEKELHFEIGFGAGEHLIGKALANPNINFIGCEPFEKGVASILSKIDKNNIKNIRIINDDARKFLQVAPKDIITTIYVLFPDPWPKKKHHKRRIISDDSLELFHKVLNKNGKLVIATDDVEYANHIVYHLSNSKYFCFDIDTKADLKIFPKDWIETRYQQKALAQGRSSVYLEAPCCKKTSKN